MLRRATFLLVVLTGLSALADECKTLHFDTKLVKEACDLGGQSAARSAMKSFQKKAKEARPTLDCKSCHATMNPNFTLKKDALETFKKLGGE